MVGEMGGKERERGKETKRQRETVTEDRKRKDGKKDKMEGEATSVPIFPSRACPQ